MLVYSFTVKTIVSLLLVRLNGYLVLRPADYANSLFKIFTNSKILKYIFSSNIASIFLFYSVIIWLLQGNDFPTFPLFE